MKNCNGCGQCCLTEKCEAAEIAVGDYDKICPFLRLISPGFYRCLLILWETFDNLEPMLKEDLGIGIGCPNEQH